MIVKFVSIRFLISNVHIIIYICIICGFVGRESVFQESYENYC